MLKKHGYMMPNAWKFMDLLDTKLAPGLTQRAGIRQDPWEFCVRWKVGMSIEVLGGESWLW